jgi:hypothetical protein
MHVGTDAEVVQLLSDVKWDCGIKLTETDLYYEGSSSLIGLLVLENLIG